MKVQLGSKGQITIPWLLRADFAMRPGDELEIVKGKKAGTLEIRPITFHAPWEGTVFDNPNFVPGVRQ